MTAALTCGSGASRCAAHSRPKTRPSATRQRVYFGRREKRAPRSEPGSEPSADVRQAKTNRTCGATVRGATVRRACSAWRLGASCPAPLVRTARRRPVRVSRTYRPRGVHVSTEQDLETGHAVVEPVTEAVRSRRLGIGHGRPAVCRRLLFVRPVLGPVRGRVHGRECDERDQRDKARPQHPHREVCRGGGIHRTCEL